MFLTFKKAPVLYKWSDAIRDTKGVINSGYIFYPHLSLFYSPENLEMPLSEKLNLLDTVLKKYPGWFTQHYSESELIRGYEVEFDRIQVRIEYDENKVSSWKKLYEFHLKDLKK